MATMNGGSRVLVGLILTALAACGGTSKPTGAGEAGTDGGSTDAATADAVAAADAGVVTGCSGGAVPCPSGTQCCTGVPYPADGSCHAQCNLKSDRSAKQDFAPVDADEVLRKIAQLPVERWSYRSEPGVRHVGPMAQDFHATFGVGPDDRTIHGVDGTGVTIAAIQALYTHVQKLEAETRELQQENVRLRAKVRTTTCEGSRDEQR